MQTISFHILWPGGNTTAIVETKLPREQYPSIAARIMQESPDIEQVGFLEEAIEPGTDLHLQMMGGEFCGNAARCAAYLWTQQNGKREVTLTVSGLTPTLCVLVEDGSASLRLPSDFFIHIQEAPEGMVVDLSGIRHIVVGRVNKEQANELIDQYSEKLPAVGVIIAEESKGGMIDITPYVWVREMNTLISETGCGSGSIAVAIAYHYRDSSSGPIYRIKQPSGETYTVTLESKADNLSFIHLEGVIENRGKENIDIDIH